MPSHSAHTGTDIVIPPSNQSHNVHLSVEPKKQEVINLSFVEEPLGLPAAIGYGWPQLEFDEAIGPQGRYIVLRKLGWGMSSSTWLARDQCDDRYVALKILNGYHTDLLAAGRVWEIEALSRISSSPPSPHCIRLLSTFKFRGREEDGEHLCIVTPVLAGNVKFLSEILGAEFGNRRLPLPLAKRIALHMLRGVAHAHGRGVIHTDLKHDNIFFSTRMDEADFKRLLESDPARRHPPELSANGTVRSAVSQPLSPHTTVEEALKLDFTVGDFGNAQHIRDHIQDEITSVQLRPPEIILGGPWSEKVDIWSVGCLLYEFVIGRPLFRYCPWPKYKLDAMSYLLYQIMVYTCEDFWPGQLAVSKLSGDYFDETGNLKAHPPMFNYPFDVAIKRSKVLGDDDADALAAIMGRCLCLNPATRATASELLSDPWFSGVE